MAEKTSEQIALKRINDSLLNSEETLDLNDLDLTFLPKEVNKLTKIRKLYLVGNQLKSLPDEIKNLTNLRSLHLTNNKFQNFPSVIHKLDKLEDLHMAGNSLKSFPIEITKLTSLKHLDLSHNRISTLPPEIMLLANLEALYLDNYDTVFFSTEDGLDYGEGMLIDDGNKISTLPTELQELKKLRGLRLQGNPLPIPPEILNKFLQPQTILNYYFSVVAQRRKPINEIKLIIVGQGSVGKTSLVQQILHGTFDQNQTKTEGISINQWTVGIGQKTVKAELSSIRLNIWDFGGQEIMHATHQFFLTKRSLYMLVLDARLTQEENRVEYWLKVIQSFGGESPVLIVGNKTDQHPLDIDRTGLQKKYPNIVGILETSAATGMGIEALKAKIVEQVDTIPHVRDLLPETWFTVKSKLENMGKETNFISHEEYDKLCDNNDVHDETSQHTLIGFLHDLGVVLYFQDDPRLESLGILNPQWVTNGVYKILNSHELFQSQGKLTLSLLNKILNLPEYPKSKHLFIVDMMKKFELCYDIESDKSFLIPDLLPKDEPFTGEWDGTLAFQIHYNVLPSSIISRFIVRMNAFIYKTVWRSGVVLKRGDNTALVKADIEDKKIYIWVNGKEETRRDLLAVIRGELDAIHKTIAKIEATEKVPLPNTPEAIPVDYEFLLRLAKEGRELLPVQAGSQIIDLIVKEVLSRIETDSRKTEIHIHGNMEGSNLVVGNKNRAANTKTKKK